MHRAAPLVEDRGRRRSLAVAVVMFAARSAGAAPPRDAPTEIELDRDDAPLGRSEFGFDGGGPAGDWGLTLRGGWLEQPITFATAAGTTEPVRRRESLALGGTLALGASVALDARMAGAHQVGDRLRGDGTSTQPLDRFVPGDLRFGLRIRVLGNRRHADDDEMPETPPGGAAGEAANGTEEPPRRFTAFVRGELTLPTGDEDDFGGEPSWSVAWRLVGRAELPHDIVVAASLGLRLRGEEVIVGDRLVGNEFLGTAGIAVGIPPIRPLWCRAEQVRVTAELATVLGDDVGIAGRGPSPAEARVGLVTLPRPWLVVGARAGAGLNDEIGAPRLRATVELTYRR